jgi:two-component sensor histidine kinase
VSRRLSQILLNPFALALMVSGLLLLIRPPGINKYVAEMVDTSVNFNQNQQVYYDMDQDGISEHLTTFFNTAGNVGIALFTNKISLGQWNFKGIFQVESPRIMFGDYDHDNLSEIYIFTLVEDSVMLHIMEYSAKPDFLLRDRFITEVGKNLMNPDHKILPGGVTEMNGDDYGDLIFAINSGFSRQPRNVYIYDVCDDSLVKSPESGAFIGYMSLCNLDGDQYNEILLSTYAASNYNQDPFVCSDTSCWMMALDHNLEYMFPPVEFPGVSGTLELASISDHKTNPLIFGKYAIGSRSNIISKIFIANTDGNIIRERVFRTSEIYSGMGIMHPFLKNENDAVTGTIENAGFLEINSDLEISAIKKIKFSRWTPSAIDVDFDGQGEIIIVSPNHENHVILRNNFTHPVRIEMPIQSSMPLFSVKLNGDKPPQLSVQGDREWQLYDYGINPVWRFRFLIWLGIYLSVLSFILIIRMLYAFQLKKKYETEKKIATLQLSSVKAQMEPHFIMNTINTIGSSIYRQKPDEAYNLLLNFSAMVRSLLVSSDKLTRGLKEEIDFVTNYLELEKSRFEDVFNYSVIQDKTLDPDAIIPKMVIQLHVENALKHGLIPKKRGGNLEIQILKQEEYISVTVRDNGIGRNMAVRNLSQSTGKGMKILNQLFETYNKYNKIKIKQEITDLFDGEKKPAGTMVKIYIPLDFNKDIY